MIAFLNIHTEPRHLLLKTAGSGHSTEISFVFKGSFSQFSFLLLHSPPPPLPQPSHGSEDAHWLGKELCPLPEKNEGKNSTFKKKDN